MFSGLSSNRLKECGRRRTMTYDGRRRPTYPISSPNEPSAQVSLKKTLLLISGISSQIQISAFESNTIAAKPHSKSVLKISWKAGSNTHFYIQPKILCKTQHVYFCRLQLSLYNSIYSRKKNTRENQRPMGQNGSTYVAIYHYVLLINIVPLYLVRLSCLFKSSFWWFELVMFSYSLLKKGNNLILYSYFHQTFVFLLLMSVSQLSKPGVSYFGTSSVRK